jgi:hypothetical protein
MNDDFLQRATARLAELTNEDGHLETMQRGITQKREALAAEIKRLSDGLDLYRSVMGLGATSSNPTLSLGDLPNFLELTLYDGIAAVMRRHGGRARVGELRDVLSESGKMTGKPANRYNTLVATMERFPEKFRRVGPGEWELVEMDSAITTQRPPAAPSSNGLEIRTSDYLGTGKDPAVFTR